MQKSMKKSKLIILIIIIVIFCLWFVVYREKIIATPITIVAFGDSLTAGDGLSSTDAYPAVLEQLLWHEGFPAARVINKGFSGYTTSDALTRVQSVILEKPDVVILAFGANDMLRKNDVEDIEKQLNSLVTNFKNNGIHVVLVGIKANILLGSEYKKDFDAIHEKIAQKHNIPLVPHMLRDVMFRPELNSADGIHPNKEGYQIVVQQNIAPVLIPFLRKTFE